MKRYLHLLVVFLTLFLFGFFSLGVLADAKSDYDYQYSQYRSHLSEYTILRQDYLDTPSLDNQQKALLSAKQTIRSRDLAKSSLQLYLLDTINSYQANYEPIKPITAALDTSRLFFLAEAQKSQSIVTQDDLKSFTFTYLATVPAHDSHTKFGIVASKIAFLVRVQLDSKEALSSLLPKLPDPMPSGLSLRIQELQNSSKVIDNQIEKLAQGLKISDAVAETSTDIFFNSRVEKLTEIRTLQLSWIERLIDIDINYVQPKI